MKIFPDGAGEEQRLLRHNADARPKRLQLKRFHILAPHEHLSVCRVIEAGDQICQRRFAGACAADHANRLAGRGTEADIGQRIRACLRIAEADVPEFQLRLSRAVRQRVRAAHHAGLRVQHLRNAARAGGGFCDVQDQIGKLDQLDQDLRHIVIKRDQLALRDRALVHADAAHAQNRDNGQIDDHIRQRIEQRGKSSDKLLRRKQISGFLREAFRLCLFAGKGTDDAHAGQIFLRRTGHAVELRLHAPVERNAAEHDGKHNGKEHRDGHSEDKRRLCVDGKGHEHRAENHDGRTQQ